MGPLAAFFKLLPKLLKFLKFGKLALAGSFIAGYSFLFSWHFAVLLFLTIYLHEWGHIITMRRAGLKTRGIYMLPFLGGVALSGERFPSQRAESYIAMGGPIVGLAMAVTAIVLYLATLNDLFAHSAIWIAVINLFNLLPMYPLDGGRVVKSVSASVHTGLGTLMVVITGICGIIATFRFGIGLLGVLGTIALLETFVEGMNRSRFKQYSALAEKSDQVVAALEALEPSAGPDAQAQAEFLRARIRAVDLQRDLTKEMDRTRPPPAAPAMSGRDIFFSLLIYGGTIGLLTTVIYLMATVIDGSAALEVLK